LINIIAAILDKKSSPLTFLTRNLMENITNYNDAVDLMSKHDLIAPAYFIIGGIKPNEGSIITRDQFETLDIWHLNSTNKQWYILETNDDHWLPPEDDRRVAAMTALNKTTQHNINPTTLFDVLSMRPVCNK
jgi:hypothetical protein